MHLESLQQNFHEQKFENKSIFYKFYVYNNRIDFRLWIIIEENEITTLSSHVLKKE